MSASFDEIRNELIEAVPELNAHLDAIIHEAASCMSEASRLVWLQNALGIARLGKGKDIVFTYLETIPRVVRVIDDEILTDILETVMKMSSVTSGEVVSLMLASLPTASQRLGDIDLMRQYFALMYQIASKTPRGIRPMLKEMDVLLEKLTMSGLRRWAQWGAQAHARDYAMQLKYFALESEDSKAVFQSQRKGTLFIDNHRSINFYLRAFWARDFFIRPSAADFEDFKPYFENLALHLPDALDDLGDVKGVELYRAMAAHIASHLAYSTAQISAEQLNPMQMFLIELIEDARIEYCAVKAFPGLRRLWKRVLEAAQAGEVSKKFDPLALRLEAFTLALLDPEYKLDDPLFNDTVEAFYNQMQTRSEDSQLSWELGVGLFNRISNQVHGWSSVHALRKMRTGYRDDNRLVWSGEEWELLDAGDQWAEKREPVRKNMGLMEFINEIDSEMTHDAPDEVWVLQSELFPYEDNGLSFNDMEGKEPVSDPFHYHEWDYKVQLLRPNWVTLYEHRAKKGDPKDVDRILEENKGISHRVKQIVDRLQQVGMQRIRRIEDGDELDINACVEAITAMRMGEQPDMRITMKNVLKQRDVSVMILLDLSESTNSLVVGEDKSIIQVTQEACSLVSKAIAGIGDAFAIHGFSSDGRHDVQYVKFKEFDENFTTETKAKLAGMKGGLSTRMGAAIRHAGSYLDKQSSKQKLMLVITDGEPADIDERDGQYLKQDAKKAVEELASKGIFSYCLTIDPFADKYVQNIFGQGRFAIVDNVARLPEKLPTLFANLTK
ncbi:MAG: nitric oxide reductase activation protein NorD [Thiomicrospira sp.]|jgi:hypothetical protein|nr:nitric oxide reductase activation protein NorD [Thiomicrospira sp.]